MPNWKNHDYSRYHTIRDYACYGRGTAFYSKKLPQTITINFFAEYTKRYQDIILNFPESINDSDFDFENLDNEERSKTLRYMRVYFDLCSEEYYLWKSNHIDPTTWKEWESGIKFAFSKTAFRKGWGRITLDTIYYQDFVCFINECMAEHNQPEIGATPK